VKRGPGRRRIALHMFLAAVAVLWLMPVIWALYTSFRPYADTAARGYVSLPGRLTLDNFVTAWTATGLPHFLVTTLAIVVPAVVVVLILASIVAFGLSRLSRTLNVGLLIVFAAGSLLPPQALVIPLFRLYLATPLPALVSDNGRLYDQALGLIAINIAFQLGFCTFVLSNYLRTVPGELIDAAFIDGASLLRALWSVVVPLARPAIAALAALQVTWIYNDYLWGLVLMRTGDKRPITSALNALRGEYFTDTNLLAAAAILVALPTLAVFLVARRQLRRGLTLGAVRG
jgi:multiple sugar transport system permease protein